MSLVSLDLPGSDDPSPPAPVRRRGLTFCDECGYDLRGLPVRGPCPECGHVAAEAAADESADRLGRHAAWGRCVCLGLALLLAVTLHAVCSVLIQPFSDIGGTAPALNLPGPKLWAMPLLQRPIGARPETPGIVGTRTAMLSMLAVWLITAPCASGRLAAGDDLLRRCTRWTSVVLFGAVFGALMAAHGLWRSELPPFRLMLVAGVELPAAVLLYLYLRRLAACVPGISRRAAFDRLAWLVPLVVAGGAAAVAVQWMLNNPRNQRWPVSWELPFGAATAYGALAMAVGVGATAAVGSLAAAYFGVGFPRAGSWSVGARRAARRALRWKRILPGGGLALPATAAGAGLLVIVMVIGIDRVSWIQSRQGIGGNVPFVNYPGPKVWITTVISGTGSYRSWSLLNDRHTLLALNLAAIWLLTAAARPGPLRWLVRWGPVIFVGAAMAAIPATDNGKVLGVNFYGTWWSRFYASVTVLGELPCTLALYLMLARLSRDLGERRLARHFVALMAAIVSLVALSMLLTLSPLRWNDAMPRVNHVLIVAAAYGTLAAVSAVWAVICLTRLATAALGRTADAGGATGSPPACGGLPEGSSL